MTDQPAITTRTCLVTGASRGIGAAVARGLSSDGHRVALLARRAKTLDAVRTGLPSPALTVPADVTDPAQVETVFSRVEAEWGLVEVLVCNAGGGTAAPIVETTDADWAATLDLNLTAPFRLMRRALPAMIARGWGRVIVIASITAKRGEAQVAAYSAAKHGVLGLVRSAAIEVARTGVTVNAVCPGYAATPMTKTTVGAIALRTGRSREEAQALLARRQPIGRLIDPEEVAEAVRFCVRNGAVTGQGINVDGGSVQS
jgi:NAD(P)-dependent dehydrogenase (short-subunit alcohol dehydrogenase family)